MTTINYRIIVGEKCNEVGHVIDLDAKNDKQALKCLRAEIKKYNGDGWGRIEFTFDRVNWEKLR